MEKKQFKLQWGKRTDQGKRRPPGPPVTDINANGDIPAEQRAQTLATLPPDDHTGKLIHLGQELPW